MKKEPEIVKSTRQQQSAGTLATMLLLKIVICSLRNFLALTLTKNYFP
jgi:hypothetical protein